MKNRIFKLLEPSDNTGDISWWIDFFLITLISFNVLAIILESVEPFRLKYETAFLYFEYLSIAIFSIEYFMRIWSANSDPRYKEPIVGNLKYSITIPALIDLMAVLPFYLPLIGLDLRFLRIMRIFELFRLLKIARYVRALTLISNVIKEKRAELFISIIFTFCLLLVTSCIMYHVENKAQPENFSSIPATMWWGIATLTTVGYGDIYPITAVGRFLGGVIAVLGIGLFALPTGILASGFSSQLSKRKSKFKFCPNCGEPLESHRIRNHKTGL